MPFGATRPSTLGLSLLFPSFSSYRRVLSCCSSPAESSSLSSTSSRFTFCSSERVNRWLKDVERSGASVAAGPALRDPGRAAAATAAANGLLLPGAAEQRGERLQPPPAVLQPGRGHEDHCHGDLRGGRRRQDRARPLLQTGRRPGFWRPESDHPGEANSAACPSTFFNLLPFTCGVTVVCLPF